MVLTIVPKFLWVVPLAYYDAVDSPLLSQRITCISCRTSTAQTGLVCTHQSPPLLQSLRNRVTQLDRDLHIAAAHGDGTTITINVTSSGL